MGDKVKVEKLEEFDPSYHVGAIVEEMLEAGLTVYEDRRIFIVTVKDKKDKIRAEATVKISSTVAPNGV